MRKCIMCGVMFHDENIGHNEKLCCDCFFNYVDCIRIRDNKHGISAEIRENEIEEVE